ncbi:CocE/NonD family hydrolase [Actinomadura fulvescens]|uniref:CocE/NonD family hydrolase n=1 Tax=Actinomadura fulvescens TaxID=46160 RepID=A0ABP6C3G2_9ACTN
MRSRALTAVWTTLVLTMSVVMAVPAGPSPAAATAVAVAAPQAWAPDPERYGIAVERNLTVKLSDGRLLRADVHTPADTSTGRPAAGPFPVVVGFTPYGKSTSAQLGTHGSGGLNPYLVKRGYIGVVVDVPGTGGSEGKFDLFSPDEARAGAEVVRWAAALPRGNGKVGMLGLSYVAIDQLFTAAEIGPGSPLKAIFPMAASVDPYRDLFTSGGALNVLSPLGLVFGYGVTRVLTPFAELASDPVTALTLAFRNLLQAGPFELRFARDMLTNGPRRYDNAYWKVRAPERVLSKIVANGVAVHLVGGLYDVFQRGEPLLYSGLQNAAAGRPVTAPMRPGQQVSSKYQLTFGPWTHGDMGRGIDLDRLQLQWFDHWLKDRDTGVTDTATPLRVLEPGGASYATANYPLAEAKPVHLSLRSGGRLTSDRPAAGEPSDTLLFTGVSNPCTRSTDQFAAGLLSQLSEAGIGGLCVGPQRKPARGPGEVTYSTEPLDRPMRLAGPIGVTLRASATRPETLWALTLEDVAPDGTSTDVSGGAQLGSMRALDTGRSWPGTSGHWLSPYHRLTKDALRPVPAGEVVRYDVAIRPAFATVPAGHRLRLRVATADFPHLVPLADLPGLLGGRYTVRHDAAAPSGIDLSVVAAP